MPDARDNVKMTGDTHLPEVESELPLQEGSPVAAGVSGTPRQRGKGMERGQVARLGRGIRKAGLLKDRDDETSDSYGNTRDSGESPDENRG